MQVGNILEMHKISKESWSVICKICHIFGAMNKRVASDTALTIHGCGPLTDQVSMEQNEVFALIE